MATKKSIQQVLEEHTDRWMSIPEVVGTAIGKAAGEPCIRVLVAGKAEELAERIPEKVDGYRVVVEESGEIRPLQ